MVRSTVLAGLAAAAMVTVTVTGGAPAAQDGDGPLLRPELAPLEFLAGGCWTGVFPGSETYDVHCYEPVFGGKFLRDVHAVPQGADVYRGETLYHWDGEAGEIRYRYYSSLGGISEGTAVPEGERIRFPDEIHRSEAGTVRVFSTIWEATGPDSYRVITREGAEAAPDDAAERDPPMAIDFRRISREEANALIPGGLE